MNCYLVLGVPQDADADTIRSAFRALARRYHPDAGAGSLGSRHLDELIDGLFQTWDELFFGAPRRRDRM